MPQSRLLIMPYCLCSHNVTCLKLLFFIMAPFKPEEVRGGTRGGREEFKWDALKGQSKKDRESYLGYTTKIGTPGQFGIWRKTDWWSNERGNAKPISEEMAAVKAYEEELFQEALGLKPKKFLATGGKLSPDQMAEMLKKETPQEPTKKRKLQDEEKAQDTGLGFSKRTTNVTNWEPSEKKEWIKPEPKESLIKQEPSDEKIGPMKPSQALLVQAQTYKSVNERNDKPKPWQRTTRNDNSKRNIGRR